MTIVNQDESLFKFIMKNGIIIVLKANKLAYKPESNASVFPALIVAFLILNNI